MLVHVRSIHHMLIHSPLKDPNEGVTQLTAHLRECPRSLAPGSRELER